MNSIIKNKKRINKNNRSSIDKNCFRCPVCRKEIIDEKYLNYFGGVCQKCGYDFYTGWNFCLTGIPDK